MARGVQVVTRSPLKEGDTVLVAPLLSPIRDGVVTRIGHGVTVVRDSFGTVYKCHGVDRFGLHSREHYEEYHTLSRLRALVGRAVLACRDAARLEAAAAALGIEVTP